MAFLIHDAHKVGWVHTKQVLFNVTACTRAVFIYVNMDTKNIYIWIYIYIYNVEFSVPRECRQRVCDPIYLSTTKGDLTELLSWISIQHHPALVWGYARVYS